MKVIRKKTKIFQNIDLILISFNLYQFRVQDFEGGNYSVSTVDFIPSREDEGNLGGIPPPPLKKTKQKNLNKPPPP